MSVPATPCPLCQNPRHLTVPFHVKPQVEDLRQAHSDARPYGWFLCENCGNAAPSHQPDRHVLEAYWHTNRDAVPGEDNEAMWKHRKAIADIGARRSWDCFSGLKTDSMPGRFLDIACGLGFTVRYFADRGWMAAGADTDRTMKASHNRLGIETRIAQVEDLEWDERFDIVQVAYALYFITNPLEFLQRLQRFIAPNGHLCLVLADLLAYTEEGGPSYLHSFVPTQNSVSNLLALAGYRVVESRRISDSWFVAAVVDQSVIQPISVARTLLRHRSRAWRWALAGRPRRFLATYVKKILGK